MAKALNMRARLIGLGCDYAQGFHLSRPLAAGALEAVLRRGAPAAL
jgi:EAL domain-containing protein (putative c-di-GMP-specific phosphodiesterase class I)